MNKQHHNRQIPLADIYEAQTQAEEIRAREKIMIERSMALAKAASRNRIHRTLAGTTTKPIDADIVVNITTAMKDNPGPGAWAASIVTKDGTTNESEYYSNMTLPLLELESLIAPFNLIQEITGTVAIHTTAKWITEFLNSGQVGVWRDNGWKKSGRDTISNADSWIELIRLCEDRKAAVVWLDKSSPEMKRCAQLPLRTFTAKMGS